MKIRMKVAISGTRNGEDWPGRGGVVDLPKAEAVSYCRAGLASPVRSDDDDVETREESKPLTKSTGPTKKKS